VVVSIGPDSVVPATVVVPTTFEVVVAAAVVSTPVSVVSPIFGVVVSATSVVVVSTAVVSGVNIKQPKISTCKLSGSFGSDRTG